jgi:hypothetical protein
MGLFNLFGLNALTAAQTVQTASNLEMSRRGFLALGGVTALTLAGCGPSSDTGLDAYGGTGGTDAGGDIVVPTGLGAERDGHGDLVKMVNLPWAFPSHIGYYTDRILGVGTDQAGVPNQIFEFLPSSPDRPIAWTSRLEVGGTRRLNYLARRTNGSRYALTTDAGFYELALGSSPSQGFVDFPAAPAGQVNFGGGAVYAGNKLFIALSSGSIGSDGFTVTFGDMGNLLVYDVGSSGAAQQSSRRLRETGGRNPTGLAMIPGTSTLLILNSGPVVNESPQSSLVLFDTNSERILHTIPLINFRAQLSGGIAVSDDGQFAVIGGASGPDVLFVDLDIGSVGARTPIPGTSFHPSVRLDASRGVAYVSDFSGIVGMLDLVERTLIDSAAVGSGGPSALAGSDLIQVIMNGAMRLYPV